MTTSARRLPVKVIWCSPMCTETRECHSCRVAPRPQLLVALIATSRFCVLASYPSLDLCSAFSRPIRLWPLRRVFLVKDLADGKLHLEVARTAPDSGFGVGDVTRKTSGRCGFDQFPLESVKIELAGDGRPASAALPAIAAVCRRPLGRRADPNDRKRPFSSPTLY